MIRLTLILAAALYIAFLVLPGRDGERVVGGNEPPRGVRERASGVPEEIVLETGEVWHVDRVIQAIEPQPEPADPVPVFGDATEADAAGVDTAEEPVTNVSEPVPRPEPAETGAEVPAAEPAPAPAPDGAAILYVTGTRVNLRAGPSTAFEIVTELDLGTPTEVIAPADDGWFEIRDTLTGLTGFMSGDFLSPTAP